MSLSDFPERNRGLADSQTTKKIWLRVIVSLSVAFLIVGLSIYIGLGTLGRHPMSRLLVEKYQLVTIVTYILVSSTLMAWVLRNEKVSLGEPMTYVGTPVVLYYFFAGRASYYALLFLLAVIMVWRIFPFITFTNPFTEPEETS